MSQRLKRLRRVAAPRNVLALRNGKYRARISWAKKRFVIGTFATLGEAKTKLSQVKALLEKAT